MKQSRLTWFTSSAAVLLLITIVATFSPVRVQITFDHQTTTANAGMLNLPTTTPLPPTSIPATAVPPTSITATAEPPTAIPATPEAPPERRERHTATPIPATLEPTPALPLRLPPQISIRKRASVAEVMPGDKFSYILVVTNSGQGSASDVVISDDIPSELKVIDLHSSKGDIVVDGQRVTAYPRTLAPGETQTYTIVVQLPAGAHAGTIANTAIITTTSIGDDPGDNTSTTTVTVKIPLAKQSAPPRLPITADPTAAERSLPSYWPLLVLALGLCAFGIAARKGAFQQQTLRIQLAETPALGKAPTHTPASTDLLINPDDLYARWNAGESTSRLVELVAAQNPQTNRLMISLTVQQLLSSYASTQ